MAIDLVKYITPAVEENVEWEATGNPVGRYLKRFMGFRIKSFVGSHLWGV